jgi:hypothetical protein
MSSEHPLRERARWDALDEALQAEHIARLALPVGVRFEGFEAHHGRSVAIFARAHQRFALVPGGLASLGEDAVSVAEQMGPEQLESYVYSQRMFRNLPSLAAYLESILLPRRAVWIAPMLMETNAVPLHDIEEQREADEPLGLVLPGVDQWEYACRAGARTLWRWGQQVPLDAYPTRATGFDAHLGPNAFGLRMTLSPWSFEVCRDERLALGGNGGTTIFEGAGYLLAWLPLASAFFELRNASGDTSFACARRVWTLDI